ncbi:MAG: GNAT family N-acetyltransferase [Promethearchaeota archaeon]
MIFREFRKNDINDVTEIFQLIYNDERKPDDYLRWLKYPKHCKNFVIEEDGKVIGRLLLDQFYCYYPEIVNFAIHPKYQGQGIGQKFVSFAVQKSLEVKESSLVIPILKNEYTNNRVKEFYRKMDFITVIKGNDDLNEWRMNFQHFAPIKDLYNRANSEELTSSSLISEPSTYFRREYEFNSENKEEMIRHINLCRWKSFISFKNRENEKVIFTVMGQPDQPIGKIDGNYCVPGLYPVINRIELSKKQSGLKMHFQNIEEIGECELCCKNNRNNVIIFDLEVNTLPNVRIRGIPEKLKLNSNEESTFKIKINLEDKFNKNIFDFSSFETIPLTIIFKNEGKKIQTFHIAINFWYHLLTKV